MSTPRWRIFVVRHPEHKWVAMADKMKADGGGVLSSRAGATEAEAMLKLLVDTEFGDTPLVVDGAWVSEARKRLNK